MIAIGTDMIDSGALTTNPGEVVVVVVVAAGLTPHWCRIKADPL